MRRRLSERLRKLNEPQDTLRVTVSRAPKRDARETANLLPKGPPSIAAKVNAVCLSTFRLSLQDWQ
ncbi:hypothetical protein Q2T83_10920 [Fervidibacter sacchari]|uniref:Uncharacterized protein n=1 Tax=Candidatus Fervidibacter sacchari TaxID=1448929 RepID=A0ABT2ETH2_9BACT|nr:hypothetical protein [Candidatus Fervidibacter sacchari]MCS3920185.1 hypothetical protein [Candidatus Fervidibacter sacchari]WKU14847.1 hypothetical protein Q2T83_10920 [Candidatus Fervidibacter sacchari]